MIEEEGEGTLCSYRAPARLVLAGERGDCMRERNVMYEYTQRIFVNIIMPSGTYTPARAPQIGSSDFNKDCTSSSTPLFAVVRVECRRLLTTKSNHTSTKV